MGIAFDRVLADVNCCPHDEADTQPIPVVRVPAVCGCSRLTCDRCYPQWRAVNW